ncbi:MAG: HAD family hydrolase [bacterium]
MQRPKNQTEKAAEIGRRIKAITFDFWGTLAIETNIPANTLSFKQRKIQYFQQSLSEIGHHIDSEKIAAAFRHVYSHFDKLWRQAIGFTARDGINEVLKFLEIEIPEDTKKQIIRFFEEIVNETTLSLFPGAKEVLPDLAERYKIGLISDTAWTPGRVLREQLRRNEVAQYFDVFIFSGEVGHCKPHPIMFQKATEALRVSASECLHIGDLQFTDVKGAKNFGCYATWIYRPDYLDNGRQDYNPDLIVESVAELGELLLRK